MLAVLLQLLLNSRAGLLAGLQWAHLDDLYRGFSLMLKVLMTNFILFIAKRRAFGPHPLFGAQFRRIFGRYIEVQCRSKVCLEQKTNGEVV